MTAVALRADWRDRAACRDEDPELFFPASWIGSVYEAQVAEAKAVCKQCPVRAECLSWALKHPQAHGVFGGMTVQERNALRRKRRQPTGGSAA